MVTRTVEKMQAEGWKANWSDRRSHITFENEEGKKVRDSNILKTFGWDVTKEALEKDLSLKVPVVTEKSTIEEILKAYMIKRKAGRADWGELPRNYDRLEQGKKLERQQEVNSPGKKQKVHMMEL